MRSLPVSAWPEALRAAWLEACRPAERLRRGGRAGHLGLEARADYARHFGYLLRFLQEEGRLDAHARPGDPVIPENIARYLDRARLSWGSVMLSRNVYKLRRAAELIGPGPDLAWLKEIEADLHMAAQPRDRSDRLVTTDRLVKAGLRLAREAEESSSLKPHRQACRYRNGLMIALLALCPIRLKNLTGLTLGTSLRRIGDRWWIVLEAEETKTGRADERPVPDLLDPVLNGYLDRYRPVLLGAGQEPDAPDPSTRWTGPVWVSAIGTRLSYSAVGVAILETTRATLGVGVNPHAFRMAAATTAAYRAGTEPHLGSALLQHTDSRVTEAHYIRASSIQAVLDFGAIVRGLTESE